MLATFSLEGKTILVTGASSGIGKAVAQQCAAAGATCIITARNKRRLEEVLISLEGENHQMIIADLSDVNAIEELIESERCGMLCGSCRNKDAEVHRG